MAKDIVIKVTLDKATATAQAQQLAQNLIQVNQQVLSSTQTAAVAQQAAIQQTNRARVTAATQVQVQAQQAAQAATAVGQATQAAATQAGQAWKQMGVSGVASFGSLNLSVTDLVFGLKTVAGALGKVKEVFDAVSDKQTNFGKSALEQLEGAAQVAALQGQRQGKAFMMEQAVVRARTFQTADELNRGQIAFRNEAEQFIGRSITASEAQKAYEATARVAVRRNVDKEAMATLTGQTFGTADFRSFGERGGEEAAVRTNKLMAILGAGSGDESHLARELGRMRASLIKKGDELHGVMSDEDAAILISLMAEVAPGQEYELGRAAIKGIRGFEGRGAAKTKPFLEKAGVTPEMPPFQALTLVKAELEKEAKAGRPGTKAEDVARAVFDIQGAQAIGGLTGKLGMVEQRRQVAAGVTAETMAAAEVDFASTQRGALRAIEARQNLTNQRIKQEMADVEIQRSQAQDVLQGKGEGLSPAQKLTDIGAQVITLGMADLKKFRETRAQINLMTSRMPPEMAAKWKQVYPEGRGPLTDVEANVAFLQMNREMRAAGINPLTGEKPAPGTPGWAELREESMGVDFGPNRGGMDLLRRKMPGEGTTAPGPGGAPAAAPQGARPMASDEDMRKLLRNMERVANNTAPASAVPAPLIPERQAQRR